MISDIVSDEEVPEHLQNDPELWSGCISGALTEEGFLAAFTRRRILRRPDSETGREAVADGGRNRISFGHGRSVQRQTRALLRAEPGGDLRGPFKEVLDDDNHRMERGVRYAVCDKTYNLYRKAPYREFFEFVEPLMTIPVEEAKPFDCSRTARRHPKETKGQDYNVTTEASSCCDGGGCC